MAGRDFDVNNVSDSSSVILNEAAVKALNQPLEKIMGASVDAMLMTIIARSR